jgi:hypothetical protein
MMGAEPVRCRWCGERIRNDNHYCPSPQEIRNACVDIRGKWTQEEERRRRLEIQDDWMLPTLAN